jgi:lipopolysaccharide transport system ATP-binding protein
VRCPLPRRLLNEGLYRLEMIASLHCREWIVRPGHNSPTISFDVQGGLSDSPYWTSARPGILAPEWSWKSTSGSGSSFELAAVSSSRNGTNHNA